ncbi:class I lanthipeptide [Pedobacter sp. WC2423]|uniref:class I lanthipeptide n=1 Tax=Pedobacter sp. WC2423 TaxID=3234142 RepID=UPI0034656087
MKQKIQLTKALKLNKESLTKLQESQMTSVKGGTAALFSSSGPKCTCGKNSCNEVPEEPTIS